MTKLKNLIIMLVYFVIFLSLFFLFLFFACGLGLIQQNLDEIMRVRSINASVLVLDACFKWASKACPGRRT
jgi:hypothetical protein